MEFDLAIRIDRSPDDVFAFLRDKDSFPQEEDSPVVCLEKTTSGPPCVGTRYREVVRMMPLYRGEILSQITHFEPGERLDEDWEGPGMDGRLSYRFVPEAGGTMLIQRESLVTRGLLRPLSPIIKLTLGRALRKRLSDIKEILESGWTPGQ